METQDMETQDMETQDMETQDMKKVTVRRVLEYVVMVPAESETPEADAREEAMLRTTSEANRERFEMTPFEESAEPETKTTESPSGTETRRVSTVDDLPLNASVMFLESDTPGRVIEETSRSVKVINLHSGETVSFVKSDNTVWGGNKHVSELVALAV